MNILAECKSIYRWQGKIEMATEVPLLIKTTSSAYPGLEDMIRANHPYELPEIVSVPAGGGSLLALQLIPYGEAQKLLLSRDITQAERLARLTVHPSASRHEVFSRLHLLCRESHRSIPAMMAFSHLPCQKKTSFLKLKQAPELTSDRFVLYRRQRRKQRYGGAL